VERLRSSPVLLREHVLREHVLLITDPVLNI
jgi:hypothetical protein